MASKQDTVRQLRDRAAEFLANSKIKKAAELYEELLALEPDSGDWARRAADCFRQLGKKERQLELLLLAARCYKSEGQLLKAIAMGKLAERIFPDDRRVSELMLALSEENSTSDRATRQFMPPRVRRPSIAQPLPPSSDTSAGDAEEPPPSPALGEMPEPREVSLPAAMSLSQIDLAQRLRSSGPFPASVQAPESEGVTIIDIDDILIEEISPQSEHQDIDHLGVPDEPPDTGQVDPAEIPLAPSELLSTLGSTELFDRLEPEQHRRLIRGVELVELDLGQQLFRQGSPADSMYVVALGEVIATAREADSGREVEIARLGSGQFFGEIGLLSDQPRQAGIVAAEKTSLLEFSREAILTLVDEDPGFLRALMGFLRMRLVETFMLTSPLFLPFGEEDRSTLQRLFRFLEVEEDATVVREGQKSDGLYVLVTGRAVVTAEGQRLGELGPGDVFGEMSLLQQRPAIASVVTLERSFLLRLPDRYFMEVLMMHPALMEHVATLGATRAEQNARLLRQGDRMLDDHVALF